jgi:hypothetical protein
MIRPLIAVLLLAGVAIAQDAPPPAPTPGLRIEQLVGQVAQGDAAPTPAPTPGAAQ